MRPSTSNLRAFRYVPVVLCIAITSSILTWSVAVPLSGATAAMQLGSVLLSGTNCTTNGTASNGSATAADSATKEEDHRKAVMDRLYNGDDAADHMGSLRLLDPDVRHVLAIAPGPLQLSNNCILRQQLGSGLTLLLAPKAELNLRVQSVW